MSSSVLKTHVHPHSREFEKHTRRMVDLLTEMKNEEEQIRQAGGAKAIDAQHKKGRLTARERIARLIDDPAHTREALIWALEAAALNPDVREFKTGVLQT